MTAAQSYAFCGTYVPLLWLAGRRRVEFREHRSRFAAEFSAVPSFQIGLKRYLEGAADLLTVEPVAVAFPMGAPGAALFAPGVSLQLCSDKSESSRAAALSAGPQVLAQPRCPEGSCKDTLAAQFRALPWSVVRSRRAAGLWSGSCRCSAANVC